MPEKPSSLSISLRPNVHPIIGKREVIKDQRVLAEEDKVLLANTFFHLATMLGYGTLNSQAAMFATALNLMPEAQRHLMASILIAGQSLDFEGNELKLLDGVYTPLVSPAEHYMRGNGALPRASEPKLWTPAQGGL